MAMKLKVWAAALLACAMLSGSTRAQAPKSTLLTNVGTTFPDNNTGAITPAVTRTFLNTLINSFQQYASVNAQVGTTYAINISDYGKLVTFNNASPIAVSLSQAVGSFSPFNFYVSNVGAGAVTITPTVSTINGGATYTLFPQQSAWIVSDGTNYQIFTGNSGVSGVFTPQQFGAVGDGIADDTTAWVNLCSAVVVAGGGTIVSPAKKTYLIYSAGQLVNGSFVAMCNMVGISGLVWDMNGSTFKVGHIFPPNLPINVTGAASGPGGVCRIQVGSTTGFYTGDALTTASIGGATGCNGSFTGTTIDGTHIDLQGTTFGGAYTSGGTLTTGNGNIILARFQNSSHIWLKDIGYTQTVPVSLPTAAPGSGTIGVAIYSASFGGGTGGGDYTLININGNGGQNPIFVFGASTDTQAQSTSGITILGGSSTNEIYGATFSNNGNDVTIRDFRASNVERTYFAYGVGNHDVSVTSLNPISNDILISSGGDATHLRPTHDIRLNYHVQKRTSGTNATSYLTFNMCGNALANNTISNVDAIIDLDMSGEGATVPAVAITKAGTAACNSIIDNIKIRGRIRGLQNFAGNAIDLFLAADSSWNSETANNISFENLYVDGSTTPSFRVDYAPFPTLVPGQLSLRNTFFPGTKITANATNEITQLITQNANFSAIAPVLAPTFGGTGLFQPAAHGIPIVEGSAAFNLAAPATAGRLLMDKGAGVDPGFALGYPVFLGGSATGVNLNSGATDTAIAIASPTANYQVDRVTVLNTGTTASLTTATAGLFTVAGGGGLQLAATQALSPITSNAINTDANSFDLATTIGSRTAINTATLQFRVGTAQGAAATGNVYVWIRPRP